MSIPFEYSCGEDVVLALDITGGTGSIADVSGITAQLRKSSRGARVIDPDAPLAATFTVVARPHVTGEDDGWTLTIPAATSAALTPGHYLVDARIVLTGGAVVISDPISVHLNPAVTRP